ncbi:MAG: NYN domain-containing protein [Clostridia bacterium]|nr:NYN domain-containing protein [Clostridia bacterium]
MPYNDNQISDDYKTEYRKDSTKLCTIISYLIGVSWDLCRHYIEKDEELFRELDKRPECRIIRHLCSVRSNLMLRFDETNRLIKYEMLNLNRQEAYKDDIRALEKDEVDILRTNYDANQYLLLVNKYIADNISEVRSVFPEWVNWDYMKSLFIMPKGQKLDQVINESKKYNANRSLYPYTRYINWQPENEGNILISDKKFVNVVYRQHDDVFTDISKVKDASDDVVANIYDFINESESIQIAVDCENSDAFKLASTLTQLDDNEIRKIDKIVLYDDVHTTNAWSYIGAITHIPTERILIERVKDDKSLVDIRMAMGISKAYYSDEAESFILLSSDSDFWGVISALPDAHFLVMAERSKCGPDIQNALRENKTYFCFIDDFCTANIEAYKRNILINALEDKIGNLVCIDAMGLVEELYSELRIDAAPAEKQNFYERVIKKIKVGIDTDGMLRLKIPDA